MGREGACLILLVDDDADTLDAFRLLLEAEGFGVVTATSATDALALLDTAAPAAIVMDLLMPDMDGFAFRERQRAIPARREVPFFVVTGVGEPMEEVASRLGIPVEHCLLKPVEPARLVTLLRAVAIRDAD
jgi:two-component system CheB/CheR fusion protein